MPEANIGELVDQLFKTHLRPDGKEYSLQEVAAALNGEIDPTYIGKVRAGKVPNPGRNTLKLLCLFFEVPASYFFPELEPQVGAGEDPARTGERKLQVALRAFGLPPHLQVHLQAVIKALQQTQKDETQDG